MPEGPEIRRAADRIARVLVDQEIEECFIAFPDLQAYESRLAGCRVTAVDTRGKAMLTRFDNGLSLYSHNQLYGRWYTNRRNTRPRTRRSLRVALHTGTHSARLYSASDVDVLTAKQERKHPFLSKQGPDILDKALAADEIIERLGAERFRRRALGGLYLDQGFLAGIGNYLRSEILFTAGLHPALRPVDLDAPQKKKLASETLRISRRAYRKRGVTVSDALASEGKAQGAGFEQYRFWVFGREDAACHVCGSEVVRTSVSSRGLFFCPGCQPAPG